MRQIAVWMFLFLSILGWVTATFGVVRYRDEYLSGNVEEKEKAGAVIAIGILLGVIGFIFWDLLFYPFPSRFFAFY